jgi:pilus assembly protein CpaE
MPSLSRRGQIIVVFGCRGGAGATTLSINLAAHLAQAGRAVCLVDLDLQLGDVMVALDLEAHATIEQLAYDVDSLDTPAVRRRMAHHRSGLYALSQVGQAAEVAGLPGRLPGLLQALTGHFDDVIVDGLASLDDSGAAVLASADEIALVMTQEVLSVRRAARVITRLRQLGQHDDRVRLVINRARRGAEIADAAIERALGLPVAAAIRDDARVTTALDDGALLAELPRARGVAGDVAELAALIAPMPRAATAPRRGLVARILGGG